MMAVSLVMNTSSRLLLECITLIAELGLQLGVAVKGFHSAEHASSSMASPLR